MSSPTDRASGSDDLSLYAPKWARDGEPERRVRRQPAPLPEAQGLAPLVPEREEEGLMIDRVRIPRSLEPGFVPEPPPPVTLRSRAAAWRRVGLALSVSSVVALIVVGKIPLPWTEDGGGVIEAFSFSSRFSGQSTRPSDPAAAALAPSPAQLISAQVPVATSGEASLLGVSLRNGSESNAVVVAGLPAGATLSAGYPYGAGGWRVPARELAEVQVYPPRGFLGQMDLAAELRDANDAIVDRRALRLEWAVPKTTVVNAPAAAPPAPKAARMLDREEIEILIRRGEDYLSSGDITSARLVLKRAAEARDPRAAFALASTYDPIVLERIPVIGVAPDIGTARNWYEKAKEFGSAEAPRRLEMLASRTR